MLFSRAALAAQRSCSQALFLEDSANLFIASHFRSRAFGVYFSSVRYSGYRESIEQRGAVAQESQYSA